MRMIPGILAVLAVGSTLGVGTSPLSAQASAETHLAHVTTGFPGAPGGASLVETAKGEVEIVNQYLARAANDPSNLPWMQSQTEMALNALDPSAMADGPGLGMGVVAAAEGIAQHIELAAAADDASDALKTHAPHVAAAARAVAERAGEMVDMAKRVAGARDYTTAEGLIERMRTMANQLTTGVDANKDGQIGWADGEGGLDQVEQHLGFITSE